MDTPTHTSPGTKRRRTVIAVLLLAAAAGGVAVAAGFSNETIRGNGTMRTQQRAASGFRGIALALPAEVEVRIGAAEGIAIEADENLLPYIETEVRHGMLELRPARKTTLKTERMKIVVQARRIEQLAVAGGGTIRAATLQTPRLGLEIGGSGTIALPDVQAGELEASIGGSGNVKLAGTTRKLSVSIAGSGDVDAPRLKADEVKVSIAGSGDAKVWPVNSLKTSIAGSGDVQYWGDPASSQSHVAGSGSVRRVGAAPR